MNRLINGSVIANQSFGLPFWIFTIFIFGKQIQFEPNLFINGRVIANRVIPCQTKPTKGSYLTESDFLTLCSVVVTGKKLFFHFLKFLGQVLFEIRVGEL